MRADASLRGRFGAVISPVFREVGGAIHGFRTKGPFRWNAGQRVVRIVLTERRCSWPRPVTLFFMHRASVPAHFVDFDNSILNLSF